MRRLALLVVVALAACGADGAPEPQAPERTPDVNLGGDLRIGVVGRP